MPSLLAEMRDAVRAFRGLKRPGKTELTMPFFGLSRDQSEANRRERHVNNESGIVNNGHYQQWHRVISNESPFTARY